MDRIFKGLRDPPRQILRNYPALHSFKPVITNRFSLCSWKVCHFLAATIEPQPSRSLTKTWHRWWILVYTLCFDDFNRENVVQFVARRASLSIQLGTAVANRFSAVWFFGELFFSFSSSPEASIITRLDNCHHIQFPDRVKSYETNLLLGASWPENVREELHRPPNPPIDRHSMHGN